MVHFARTGTQDLFLTDQPTFTYFNDVIKKNEKISIQSYEIPFDQPKQIPGTILRSTLPKRGSFIKSITLKVKEPQQTPQTTIYTYYNTSLSGNVYAVDTTGTIVTTYTANTAYANTSSLNWITITGTGTITSGPSSSRFSFSYGTVISYFSFTSFELANLFGFDTKDLIPLYGGFVKVNINSSSFSSTLTYAESGWLPGQNLLAGYAYPNAFYDTASLYMGGQMIQSFPYRYIKIKTPTQDTYTNNPLRPLLEGDSNPIFEPRVYYSVLPLMENIPMTTNLEVQVRLQTSSNVINSNAFASLIVEYITLEKETSNIYDICVNQLSTYGPVHSMIIDGTFDTYSINNHKLFDTDQTNVHSFDNLFNPGAMKSKIYVFNNPMNMSRIIDQKFQNLSGNVYTESYNVLAVRENLAGLRFNS